MSPVVVDEPAEPDFLPPFVPSPRVRPFAAYDFRDGDWAAYLLMAPSDLEALVPSDAPGVSYRRSLPLSLCAVLRGPAALRPLAELELIDTGGDIATTESTLVLVRGTELVRVDGVALQQTPVVRGGLQGRDSGYLHEWPTGSLLELARRFEPVRGVLRIPGVRPAIDCDQGRALR